MDPREYPLDRIAAAVGTPFYFYDAGLLRGSFGRLASLADAAGTAIRYAIRYAMKANSARPVLDLARAAGLWIDATGGNEALRALRAGFAPGNDPPVVMLTSDVFRDNALDVIRAHDLLANVGSPGMIRQLAAAGGRGPIALRLNPGFGHGHVQSCDTGGPSSKHGVWHEDAAEARKLAAAAGMTIGALHAHVGSGPEPGEFDANLRRVVDFFAAVLPDFPDVTAVNLGGGLPFPYRPGAPAYDLGGLRAILADASPRLAKAAGRSVRIEIEPGRFPVAGAGLLAARVHDVKHTHASQKGPAQRFVMVDAGFADLARPAMYGAYHHITVVGAGATRPPEPLVVAGPLCESGDVFTRDAHELLDPRPLPRPEPGDLLVLHDAGAYGYAMSSNYVSVGRPPQVLWDAGRATLVSRRETVDDLVRAECAEPLAV